MQERHDPSVELRRLVDRRGVPGVRHDLLGHPREMAQNGVVYLAEHPLVRGLFSGAHDGLLPDWTDRFEQLRTMGRASVAEVLRMGVRSGEFRPDIDVEEFAAILQDLTHAGYVLYGDRWVKDPSVASRRITGVIDLALNGLRKP